MKPMVSSSESVQLWTEVLNIVGGLVLVIALIFLLSWFLRKSGRLNSLASNRLNIVCSRSIGNREKLLLIEVNGREILLGVTATSINHLYDFQADNGGFAEELDKVMGPGQEDS